jgi:thioredoxin 1
MLKKIAPLFVALTALLAAEATITFTPYKSAAKYIGQGKPVMLEVGAESCVNCKKMNEILAPIMAKHPNYRIYDIILKPPAVNILSGRPAVSTEEKLKIHAIPVQIFYNGKGEEVYRHTGLLSTGELYSIFKKLNF